MVRGSEYDEARHALGWSGASVSYAYDSDLDLWVPSTEDAETLRCMWSNGLTVCGQPAGWKTNHVGLGYCWRHDSPRRKRVGAWMMAHAIAREIDISPWEALLLAVRRAATRAAFYELKLAQVTDDEELRPGGAAHDWVVASERVNDKMARYAKMAVDAGVAAMLVQQAQTEGAQIARVFNAAIAAGGLSESQETAMRTAFREALLAIEAPPPSGAAT